jgi:hypothetical protein
MSVTPPNQNRRGRGFQPAARLLKGRIRSVGESRGFAVSRLLTHWSEVVGEEIAAMALPVKVGYGREGFGATLTLLTTGASAPLLQMQLPKIRDKVNACYGYNAISRVAITQTAPTGFAEGQVAFAPKPKPAPEPPDPAIQDAARTLSGEIGDQTLRAALEALGEKVLSQPRNKKG